MESGADLDCIITISVSHGDMTSKWWEGVGKEIVPKDHWIAIWISMLTKKRK